jgi:hypothetical protein
VIAGEVGGSLERGTVVVRSRIYSGPIWRRRYKKLFCGRIA